MNDLWSTNVDVRDPSWFADAGFHVQPGFLTPSECVDIIREIDETPPLAALVAKPERAAVLDEHTRRSCCALVGDPTIALVSERLSRLAPTLATHFDEAINVAEAPNFLVYRPGDFFAAHRDCAPQDHMPEYIRHRRIGAIVFLNRQVPRPHAGAFCGGSLGFYRLHTRDGRETARVAVRAEPGTLIAFPSHVVHEVRPVLHGRRYSIVSFYSWTAG